MGLRIALLVVATAAAPNGSTTTQPSATLPNPASYGPSRRGDWRVDANVPQTPTVHREPARATAPPPRTTSTVRYAAHPYDVNTSGFVLRSRSNAGERARGRLHAGQFAVDGGQSGPTQGRAGLSLRVALWRFGFDANVHSHFTGAGSQARPLRTRIVHGSTHARFAAVLRPKLMWWLGAGLGYAAQQGDVGVGPNLTSTIDLFPRRPLVLSARGDIGTVGGLPTAAGRGTVGFMLQNFELQVGYEARRLGDQVLLGPMLGARAWF